MNLKRVSLGVASFLFLVSCGGSQDKKQEEVAEYPTEVLAVQDAVLESKYPASIKGQEDIEIRPRVNGFIKAIYVDEGSVVRKGQELFSIDSPQSIQALETAQASVRSAQAQLETAQINVDRIAPLAEKGIVSEVQLRTYQNAYKTAQASLDQANAVYNNAKATVAWTKVTSPVDGIVGAIPFRLGSLVNDGNTLTTISNTTNMYVYFSLNEKDLMGLLSDLEGATQSEKIKNLPKVSLILADGTVYSEQGTISTITGQANVSTGSVNFRADFPNKEKLLRSGFSGTIVIPHEVHNVFVIPQKSTFQLQDKYMVYKVQGDSTLQTVVSVTPLPDGKNYIVTNGLSEGDRIVVDGLATMSHGKKIKVK